MWLCVSHWLKRRPVAKLQKRQIWLQADDLHSTKRAAIDLNNERDKKYTKSNVPGWGGRNMAAHSGTAANNLTCNAIFWQKKSTTSLKLSELLNLMWLCRRWETGQISRSSRLGLTCVLSRFVGGRKITWLPWNVGNSTHAPSLVNQSKRKRGTQMKMNKEESARTEINSTNVKILFVTVGDGARRSDFARNSILGPVWRRAYRSSRCGFRPPVTLRSPSGSPYQHCPVWNQ